MKLKKMGGICIGFIVIFYLISLFFISAKQNKYNVTISSTENYYICDIEDQGSYKIPIIVHNKSEKTISTQLGMNMSYHLYSLNQDKQELISIENVRTELKNIYPNKKEQVQLLIDLPRQKGKYIIYVDIVEEGKSWYSEHGMLTNMITIEVK